MITRCRHCRLHFWRYRPDHPPAGYCSVPCWESGYARSDAPLPVPSAILMKMREHRLIMHGTTSMLAWFDCETCEDLEFQYGQSLDYHYGRISGEIAAAARSAIRPAASPPNSVGH